MAKQSEEKKVETKHSFQRLASLDAYRGFTMILLATTGFGLLKTAKNFPDSSTWQTVGYLFDHVKWGFLPDIHNRWDFTHWITLWDMIQPSFMFMVGVSMPFSYLSRKKKGHSYFRMLAHAVWRAIILVLLGIFLRSLGKESTNWFFMDVVAQIGLGYIFLFLLWNKGFKIQLGALVLILVGYWAFFAFSPLPGEKYDYAAMGSTAPPTLADPANATEEEKTEYEKQKKEYESTTFQYSGFEAHWNRGTNPAQTFDLWFMNLFPQNQPGNQYERTTHDDGTVTGKFKFNRGGYQVLNFIPALATMLLGLMAGTLLQSNEKTVGRKLLLLFSAGLLCIAIGKGIDIAGFCPIVKKIWTPTWTLFSGGWCLLILMGFYLVMDVIGFRFWAFPAMVVGVNSIAIYLMGWTLKTPVLKFLKTHFGKELFTLYGRVPSEYGPTVQACLIATVFWLILYWMYRNKFFIRV